MRQQVVNYMRRREVHEYVTTRIVLGKQPREVLESLTADDLRRLLAYHALTAKRTKQERIQSLLVNVYSTVLP